MLDDPSSEIVEEGYSLLFRLWLEYSDSKDFTQDLKPIAINHKNIIQEFENRLNELVIKDTITDTFLKSRLKVFASEVSRSNLDSSQHVKQPIKENDGLSSSTITKKQGSRREQITGIGIFLFGLSGVLLGFSIWLSWDAGTVFGSIMLAISLLILLVTFVYNKLM